MSQCILGKTKINISESAEVSSCCCRIIVTGKAKVKKVKNRISHPLMVSLLISIDTKSNVLGK